MIINNIKKSQGLHFGTFDIIMLEFACEMETDFWEITLCHL